MAKDFEDSTSAGTEQLSEQNTKNGSHPSLHETSGPGENSSDPVVTSDDESYPSTAVALTVMIANLFSMFLVSLDRTIIATAIPYITDHFGTIQDISWYGSAYMLANCSLQLLYGRIYKFYPTKYVFLASICLFEVGSAICGAAPTSTALIVGRAIAGSGSSGIMSGVMQMLVFLVPLARRPLYTGMFGAVFALSSVVGPLLGGILTQRLSWRWCFFINLPFGALSILAVVFLVKARQPVGTRVSLKDQINQLDPIGTVVFIPSVVCLLLALQWGGTTYPWKDGRMIALWVVFGLTFLTWIAIQGWKKDNATVPPRIFFQRSILAGFVYATFVVGSMLLVVYYMPLWFQAIKDDSPIMSGISTLPNLLAIVTSAALSGIFTQRVGYYVPTMILGPMVSAVGAGLLTTLKPNTGHSKWISYQFLYGFGVGMGLQQASLAAQAVLPGPDISIGIALMFFGQQLGGAIFLAVGQSVFTQQLVKGLSGFPGLEDVLNAGATKLRDTVPAALLPEVLIAYNKAIVYTWYVSLALSATMVIPALCMEWKNIKGKGLGRGPPGAAGPKKVLAEK